MIEGSKSWATRTTFHEY